MKRWHFPLIVLGALGCAATQPTPELVDARRSYDQLEHGTPNQVVPDRVLMARQALDRAEAAHRDHPGSYEEQTYAYVAQRRIAQAAAQAAIAINQKQVQALNERYDQLQDEMRRSAQDSAGRSRDALRKNQEQLDAVRKQLAQQSDRLGATAQELARKEKELESRQQELVSKQGELDTEKTARAEAEKKAAAAIASLNEIAKVAEEQRGMVITLDGNVLFTTGKASLLPIAEQKLGKVAEVLMQQPDTASITIEGHTDSVGADESNQKLSQERAETVRSFLIGKGVPATRITAVGRGETTPIGDNKTAEGRAMNRRVEIVVGKK